MVTPTSRRSFGSSPMMESFLPSTPFPFQVSLEKPHPPEAPHTLPRVRSWPASSLSPTPFLNLQNLKMLRVHWPLTGPAPCDSRAAPSQSTFLQSVCTPCLGYLATTLPLKPPEPSLKLPHAHLMAPGSWSPPLAQSPRPTDTRRKASPPAFHSPPQGRDPPPNPSLCADLSPKLGLCIQTCLLSSLETTLRSRTWHSPLFLT